MNELTEVLKTLQGKYRTLYILPTKLQRKGSRADEYDGSAGELVCAEGRYIEGNAETGIEKRAAIFIGPEFSTVSRPVLVAAAREAGDAYEPDITILPAEEGKVQVKVNGVDVFHANTGKVRSDGARRHRVLVR